MTIHFGNTEGNIEQQNICLHHFTEFSWTAPFARKQLLWIEQINQLIPNTCNEEKHISIIIAEQIIHFCHRLGWKVIVPFSHATREDTCRDTNPNSAKFKQNKQQHCSSIISEYLMVHWEMHEMTAMERLLIQLSNVQPTILHTCAVRKPHTQEFRIIEWFALVRTSKGHPHQFHAISKDIFSWIRLLRPLSNLTLDIPRDGGHLPPLWATCANVSPLSL